MEKRPRIKIDLKTTDYIVETLGIIGIACLIVLPFYFFNDLPNQIPKHFNIHGQPNSYGHRGLIWLLPIIGVVIYISLTVLSRFPFIFNYPVKVTIENAERLYTIGTRTVRLLKAIVILLFAFLNFRTIEIGLNKTTKIGELFLPIFLIIITVLIGIMIFKILKNKNTNIH